MGVCVEIHFCNIYSALCWIFAPLFVFAVRVPLGLLFFFRGVFSLGYGVRGALRRGNSSSLISFCALVCLFIELVVVVVGQRNHILLLSKFSVGR